MTNSPFVIFKGFAQEEVFKLCRQGVPYSQLEDKTQQVLANGLIKLGIIKTAGRCYL